MRHNFRNADTCVYCKLCLSRHVDIYYTEYFCNLDERAPVNSNGKLDLEKFKYNRDVHEWKQFHSVEITNVCDDFVKIKNE